MKLPPQLISWQCNISILRFLSMPYVLWYWAHNVRLNPEYPWIGHCISGLGCVFTQVVVNFCLSVLVVLHIVLDAQRYLPVSFEYYPISAAFEVFVMIVGLCSLCLMGISLSSILALHSCVPVRQLWKTNTKDAFGVSSPTASPHTLILFGRPRETKIPLSGPFVLVCRVMKMRLTYLLFRRIRPVETRIYAFARNSFAIVAIGILIFRTATALQRAQNEIGTRVISRTCDDASPSHYISIVSDRLIYDSEFALSDVNVSVSIVWPSSIGGYKDESASNASDPFPSYWSPAEYNCTVVQSRRFKTVIDYGVYQTRTLELFMCDIGNAMIDAGYSDDQLAYYRVNVRPAAMGSETRLLNIQMPHIWLVNMDELNSKWSNFDQVRMYLPPLKLRYGSHLVAQASLITRRFIKSSLMKDIIFNFKPEHESLSLYPIAEPSMVPLNSSDINIATAIIRPVLAPGLMYHRNRADSQIPTDFSMLVCDYIEDYRASTIVDVIGSVGGLFALLQAMHLLFFGRPLLWGLTGTKLLSPFGILGQCSSRGFKRRLKEGYHVGSGDDGTETIRIVKFLRDFVIDFGPADLDLEKCPERRSASPTPVSHGRSAGTPIPMVQMNSDGVTVPQKENHSDESSNYSKDPDRIHDMV